MTGAAFFVLLVFGIFIAAVALAAWALWSAARETWHTHRLATLTEQEATDRLRPHGHLERLPGWPERPAARVNGSERADD